MAQNDCFMKKFFYLLALLPMTIFFTSCPPEPKPDPEPTIVGCWRVTSVDWYDLWDGNEESGIEYIKDYDWLWTFDEDGDVVEYENSYGEVTRHRYSYYVKGKHLFIDGWRNSDNEPSYIKNEIKITKLTENKLQIVWEYEDPVGDADYEYCYYKYTYNFTREY